MHLDDCYQLGYIIKPHGLKGELKLFIDADIPENYQNLESFFVLKEHQMVPFFIEYLSIKGNTGICALEEILSIEDASILKGLPIYLPLTMLPELPESEFYLHDLQHCQLYDQNNQWVGEVKDLVEAGPQILLTVYDSDNRELLIPYNKELLKSFDKEEKKLCLEIPEGLIDIYIEDHED